MKKLFLIGYGCWGALGAYRGVQEYNKQNDKENKFYLKYPDTQKPEYYYLSCFGYSLKGIIEYMGPPFIVFNFISELYNLERVLRNIKEE